MMRHFGARCLLAFFWLLHWLPLPVLAALGQGLGWLIWPVARLRRHIALTNLRLCFPDMPEAQRVRLARQHLGWLMRSLLERSLLLYASPQRLRRLVQVDDEVALQLAQRNGRPTMWLLPHFVGLEFVGPALMLRQTRPVVDVYQKQANPVFDAALCRARARLGPAVLVDRSQGVRPVVRAIHAGAIFLNAPDMDFGRKDSAFVPFFGMQANTLVSPSRMARTLGMQVQTMVLEMLPAGRGYLIRMGPPPPGFEDEDPVAAAAAWNRWLEVQIQRMPAQYLWVHRRFKTRPPGQAKFY